MKIKKTSLKTSITVFIINNHLLYFIKLDAQPER